MEVIRGYLQAYDWGPVDAQTEWTPATGGSQAELWFGSHPNGRSPLRDGGGSASAQMPILVKLLAAARPLSIQIHPPADLASSMFAAQTADPAAPQLLSDPRAKAEILLALEPFAILEGFRDPRRSSEIFARLGDPMGPAAAALAAGDLPGAVRVLLALPDGAVAEPAGRLPAAFAAVGLPAHDVAVITEVVDRFPGDPGVFVAALLNARTLSPGQSVYVEPGTVHAYVRGLGVEVMTNSDNVLRLGLTSKTIAIDAALAAVDPQAQPHDCSPERSDGIRTYAPDGAPFVVRLATDTRCEAPAGSARVLVCLRGTVRAGGVVLAPGEGLLLESADPSAVVDVDGEAVLAQHRP